MKLLTAQQLKDWDAYTIMHEPISSLQLMERAAAACAREMIALMAHHAHLVQVVVCCGPGNNGGDGLAIARLLNQEGKNVTVLLVGGGAPTTADAAANKQRLPSGVSLVAVDSPTAIPAFTNSQLVVDALFGTGLNRAPEGMAATLIDLLNASQAYVVAIDIPSGLPASVTDIEELSNRSIVKADCTLTFQLPKKSFMHAECAAYTGKVVVLDIGLHPGFVPTVSGHDGYITAAQIRSLLKPRPVFSHKGTYGHVLVVAGSYGKLGAAILTSKAAMRTGCGLLTAYVPKVGYTVLQTALPEAMVLTDDEVFEWRTVPDTTVYAAVAVGPGMGTSAYTQKGLLQLLAQLHQPVVLDADALNIIAGVLHTHADFTFPKQCIITPHPKEFDRLAGHSSNSFERLHKQRVFAQRHQVVVVLKGAHTSICTPDGNTYFNSSGNPALATAGSGDVLTGILVGLLAQHYTPEEAALVGVYLHGRCADRWVAAGKQTMMAGDIIETIPSELYLLNNHG